MPEVFLSMSGRWNQRSLFARLLVYVGVATSVFILAAGVGTLAALVVSGNPSWPTGGRAGSEEPNPPGERGKPPQRQQADADRAQQENLGATRVPAASPVKRTTYVDEVGEIQAGAVEAFLDSHEKLLRYDALKSRNIEKMQANQAALQRFANQANELRSPRKYTDQKDSFLSAIDELHRAAQLAYALAADPISATQAEFDHYDSLVNEAAADLQKSNKFLGKDFRTIDRVHRVGTSK